MYILKMLVPFTKSASLAVPQGFYAGPDKPFEKYVIPDYVENFTQDMMKRCGDKDVAVDQILLFGGNARDQMRRMPSKDTDLYIAAPALVDTIEALLEKRTALADIGRVLSSHLPMFIPDMDSMKVSRNPDHISGESFGLTGLYWRDEVPLLDIAVGRKVLDPVAFSKDTGAPIMSFVATVHGKGPEFVYHKDMVADAEAKILRAFKPNDSFLEEKAAAKGWTFMPFNATQGLSAAPAFPSPR